MILAIVDSVMRVGWDRAGDGEALAYGAGFVLLGGLILFASATGEDPLDRRISEREDAWEDGPSAEEIVRMIRSRLEARLPSVIVEETHEPGRIRLCVPTAASSDYTFWVNIYADPLEASVGADLRNDPEIYFWKRTFEQWEYASPEEMITELTNDLVRIATSSSRVRETRGWFTRGYLLTYWESGVWFGRPGDSALRFANFNFPEPPACGRWKAEPFNRG